MVRNGATRFAEFSVGNQSIDEFLDVRFGDLLALDAARGNAAPRVVSRRTENPRPARCLINGSNPLSFESTTQRAM
jgi:hypothetical protein